MNPILPVNLRQLISDERKQGRMIIRLPIVTVEEIISSAEKTERYEKALREIHSLDYTKSTENGMSFKSHVIAQAALALKENQVDDAS